MPKGLIRFICQIFIFLGKKEKKKKKKNKKEDEEDDLDKALADLKIEVNVDDDAAAKKKAKKVKEDNTKKNQWYFVTKIVLTYCEKKLF